MKVEKFDKIKHLDMLINWYNQWELSTDSIKDLPPLGLIIPNICAFFIYETNSSTCFVEGLISNKEISEEQRQLGIQIIFNAMLEIIKHLGYKKIITFSNNSKVIEKAILMGCTESKKTYSLLCRSV